jgi:hypothetical protein
MLRGTIADEHRAGTGDVHPVNLAGGRLLRSGVIAHRVRANWHPRRKHHASVRVFGWNGLAQQLGAWHYNGRTWTRAAKNVDGGSALSASNVWGFSGTSIDHYSGRTWTSTSVKSLLPPRQPLTHPQVTGIYAQSADSVYAIGNGGSNVENAGGPLVGGFWLPMPGTVAMIKGHWPTARTRRSRDCDTLCIPLA